MSKPRLIYYNDARHYSFYRYDPPMSRHQIRQPIDEILGTQVDMVSFGLASGSTFLHDSKVGLRWGEGVEVHNHGVMWWRASECSKQAIEAGNDPLKVVVDRAHEKGRKLICSMRMNDAASQESGNLYMTSRLKLEKPEIMIGDKAGDDARARTCADFSREDVRAERLAVIEEVTDRYGADGLEIDPYVGCYFAPSEARDSADILTDFVREVRALFDRIGEKRGQKLTLAARVYPELEDNLAIGMDVETWLSTGLVDLAVVTSKGSLHDGEMPIGWVIDAAKDGGATVYPQLSGTAYDDRDHDGTIEMYRAIATNYFAMGVDGVYLSDLGWPYDKTAYEIMREMGDPDIFERKNKQYFLPQREPDKAGFIAERDLPITLEEGKAATVSFVVGDKLDAAREDNELDGAVLGIRIVQTCPEDRLSFAMNGKSLEPSRVTHYYGGLVSYTAARSGLEQRINTHYWFWFDLPIDLVREGKNEVVVTMDRHFTPLAAERVLHQVELKINYVQPFETVGGQM
jgi:hypothetical protein